MGGQVGRLEQITEKKTGNDVNRISNRIPTENVFASPARCRVVCQRLPRGERRTAASSAGPPQRPKVAGCSNRHKRVRSST
jgi:hypothetical protein